MSEADVGLVVETDGAPVAGALVLVRAAATMGPSTGPVLFTALTDEHGRATGIFTRTSAVSAFEVTVIKAGFEGDIDDADREQLGAFAPAARVRVDGSSRLDAVIQLSPSEIQ